VKSEEPEGKLSAQSEGEPEVAGVSADLPTEWGRQYPNR